MNGTYQAQEKITFSTQVMNGNSLKAKLYLLFT